jgi:formate dehydrogenase subunit gamma
MPGTIFSRLLALLVIGAFVAFAAPDLHAQQVNPTADSVHEDALLEALQSGQAVSGRVTIPDPNAGQLISPGNVGWASTHGTTVWTVTLLAFVGMLVLLAVFYMVRGKITLESGFSGRKILRFNAVERFAHWLLAVSFVVLALTGLNLVIGRSVLLPIIGGEAFGTLSTWGKIAHNYLAWPFMGALAFIFVLWVARNIPQRIDLEWFRQGGFMSKGAHPPAGKFNAGQKLLFWLVILGGAAVSYTGIMLLFPQLAGTAADWQFHQVVHALVAAGLTAVILGHIYIGTLGMEGAFDAMGSGEVDENWAKEHHPLWVEELESRPAPEKGAAATPAE